MLHPRSSEVHPNLASLFDRASYIKQEFDGAETNCGIARVLGILLMNGYGN